jgi:hypothetical protein
MTPPQVRTISPAVRVILGGVLLVGAAMFMVGMHRPPRSPLADIKVSNDGWWLHQQMPTPHPTPRAVVTPTLKPIVVQQPPKLIPHSQPSICQICMERQMRYAKAIETGMGANVGSNIHQQLTGQPTSMPSPSIFAYGTNVHE